MYPLQKNAYNPKWLLIVRVPASSSRYDGMLVPVRTSVDLRWCNE